MYVNGRRKYPNTPIRTLNQPVPRACHRTNDLNKSQPGVTCICNFVNIPSGLQGQGVHKWNLPSPYSVGWVFKSCILPSSFNNDTWYFQTLLFTQFDGYVVVYVFQNLYHEMYLMPMSVESSNPLIYFQGAYLKATERTQKQTNKQKTFTSLFLLYLSSMSYVPLLQLSVFSFAFSSFISRHSFT